MENKISDNTISLIFDNVYKLSKKIHRLYFNFSEKSFSVFSVEALEENEFKFIKNILKENNIIGYKIIVKIEKNPKNKL